MISAKLLYTWLLVLPLAVLHVNCQLRPFTPVTMTRSGNALFDYKDPNEWGKHYPGCIGVRQSPVALYAGSTMPVNKNLIHFHNYDVPFVQLPEAYNNGKSIEIVIGKTLNGEFPYITVDGMEGNYIFNSLHFHWGSENKKGSEHSIGGERFDLEMHMVHMNSKYLTVDAASNDPEGLIVLSVLFEQVMNGNDLKRTGVNTIFDALPFLTNFHSKHQSMGPFTAESLLNGVNTSKFYTYKGSLTTPPCSQAVVWFVFADIVPIPRQTLKLFWSLLDDVSRPLLNNNRPLQSLVLFRSGLIAQ